MTFILELRHLHSSCSNFTIRKGLAISDILNQLRIGFLCQTFLWRFFTLPSKTHPIKGPAKVIHLFLSEFVFYFYSFAMANGFK